MIPTAKLENLDICRFICGSNPFCGISHFTPSRDMFYKEYFADTEKIAEIMGYLLEEFGVNAIISSPRDNIAEALEIVRKEYEVPYHWICTPSSYRASAKGMKEAGMMEQIQWCKNHEVSVCMPHRSYTDKNLDTLNNEIRGLPEITAAIRDAGMIPGLSTHYYETLKICRQQKYDIKLIIQPLNTLGFMSNIEVNTLASVIQSSPIQILNIKPLAAGRILPEVGLSFCYNNIKPNDFLTCGFASLQDADYDAQIAERILAKK